MEGEKPNIDDSWKLCLKWLIDLHQIGLDDSITKETSTVAEFQTRLLNGVLLCNVLRYIRNDLTKKYQMPLCMTQKSKYIWKSNLGIFKKICIKEFGISKNQIFKTDDLSDFNNFLQVLEVLSIISKTEEAKFLAPSFDIKLTENKKDPNLESVEPYYDLFPDTEGKSYMGYYDVTYERNDNSLTSSGLSYISAELVHLPRLPEQIDSSEFSIFNCHYEFLQNEQNYLQTLTLGTKLEERLCEYFGGYESKTIFYKFHELKLLHRELLEELCLSYPNNFSYIKSAFEKHSLDFLVYLEYCTKYEKHSTKFRKSKKCDGKTAAVINNIEEKYGDIQNVFMLAVYERIPIYIKKLQNLRLMCTSENDSLYVSDALVTMIKLGRLIGTSVSDEEIKTIFKDEKFEDLHKIPEKFRNFETSGRHIFDDHIQFAKQNSYKISNGRIFVFEEGILLFRKQTSRMRIKSKEERYEFYKLFLQQDVYPELSPKIHSNFLPEKQRSVKEFTLDKDVTKESLSLIPSALYRECEVRAAVLKVRNIRSYKERSHHHFFIHTLPVENIRENIFCEICHKYFLGSYGQCYLCQTCNLKCHGYCLLLTPEIDCGNDYYIKNNILHKPWWEGEISRNEAEELLAKLNFQPNSFLLRWSSKAGSPVLSVCDSVINNMISPTRAVNNVKHIIIESKDYFSFRSSTCDLKFQTLSQLVRYFADNSINLCFQEIDAKLRKTLNPDYEVQYFAQEGTMDMY